MKLQNTMIEREVLKVLESRWLKGRETYGGGMRANYYNAERWLDEAIDEAADLLQYLVAYKTKLNNEPKKENKCGSLKL